jgi:hypothetical protein
VKTLGLPAAPRKMLLRGLRCVYPSYGRDVTQSHNVVIDNPRNTRATVTKRLWGVTWAVPGTTTYH